jgi:predicted RNA methylase
LLRIKERKLNHQLQASGWTFSEEKKSLLLNETIEWVKYYLPLSVSGLTILDVGAGEGETAKFFLENGATNVICIEPHVESFKILKLNAINHNLLAVNKRFELSDLKTPHDFVKVDIEGYEEVLLDERLETPAIVEVHGLQLCDRFKAKGYRLRYPYREAGLSHGCVAYAYWDKSI